MSHMSVDNPDRFTKGLFMNADERIINEVDINVEKLDFAIFCIENLGKFLKKNAKDIYQMLTGEDNLLDDYIIYGYEALHTQGKEYLMEDITDIMRRKGIEV